jgi:hypothetical protein
MRSKQLYRGSRWTGMISSASSGTLVGDRHWMLFMRSGQNWRVLASASAEHAHG